MVREYPNMASVGKARLKSWTIREVRHLPNSTYVSGGLGASYPRFPALPGNRRKLGCFDRVSRCEKSKQTYS